MIDGSDCGLWPKGRAVDVFQKVRLRTSVGQIEGQLAGYFPTGYPVLCTSARVAIVLVLKALGLKRLSSVRSFPYASHCLLDAISRVATPIPIHDTSDANVRIVNHQWGYVQRVNNQNEILIEDAVDTLCEIGTTLFPNDGDFEVWSLPKILGTTSGGVVWCRDALVADQVRLLRDEPGPSTLCALIRLAGRSKPIFHHLWQGGECEFGAVSHFCLGELVAAVDNWSEISAKRMQNNDVLDGYKLDGLVVLPGRLPSVVPLSLEMCTLDFYSNYFHIGKRHISCFRNGEDEVYPVLPVPVHHEVSQEYLKVFLGEIATGAKGVN